MKMSLVFLFVLTTLLVGCANSFRKNASAGQIGCPQDEVKISDENSGLNSGSWVATCRGQRFYCSAVSGGNSVNVSCKEELKKK